MYQIMFDFPTEKDRDIFWGWFLDGGGDQDWLESADIHGDETTCNYYETDGKIPYRVIAARLDEG